MLTRILLLFFCITIAIATTANDYEEAWKALHKNDRKTALALLEKAFKDPATAVDAYITYIYLSNFEGRGNAPNEFIEKVYKKLKDPNPYLFALWFNDPVLGGYGKKNAIQLDLLEKILSDRNCNGSLKSAAYYVNSWHLQASNNIAKARKETEKMGSVGPLWQLAGPFDNLSGSGYYKDFGPLQHPEANAVFKSAGGADISWFTPAAMNMDGWTFPHAHIRYNTAVVYAQNFVNAPADMKVLLNAGGAGAMKVWVNDEQIIAEKLDLVTELDYYKNHVQLKKGYNRILVQLAYSNTTSPNFIVRFTDDNYNSIPGLTYTPALQQYTKGNTQKQAEPSLRHFAEIYFEQKIKQQPDNIVNYILLAETYLRDKKTAEARALIEDILEKFPDNSLLRVELMLCHIKDNNRTLLLQETERMKEKDPECPIVYKLNIQKLLETEKYDETEEALTKYATLFGNDDDMFDTKIKLYGAQNKMDVLIKTIEDAYKANPENTGVLEMMFNVKMQAYKDVPGALGIYEKYLKSNFNFQVLKALARAYNKQGKADKELQILKSLSDNFPYDPDLITDVSSFYFDQQNYKKATEFGRQALTLAPYVATYWENLGTELQHQDIQQEAIDAYKKAIYYEANKYSARERLRELQKKSSVWKAFPETDVYELVKKADNSIVDYDYYYLLDEKSAVIYPEGASEEYYTLAIQVVTQKGIDNWKETSISYNSNSSDLFIEKAETVKKNGVKTPAEKNGNQLVFTGLDAGDAIVIKYKIQNYAQGRLGKEYWNKFIFNAFVPEKLARFNLLVANNVKFNHAALNMKLEPKVSSYDDFKLYTWQKEDLDAFKGEPYMPSLQDVGASISVSTINSWNDIATWYSDLSAVKTDDDFEVRRVFNELFPKGTASLSQKNIAIAIYNYIEKNIRYSSVAFRQSAYVPQKPSVTINTSLGDCKDLSALFVSLAKLANIKANLVLVNTRDYGQNSMVLPSVEFNHCIVKALLDGKPYYIELTDNNLPFGSLPTSLYEAASLVIPANAKDTVSSKIEFINAVNRTKEKTSRKIYLSVIDDNDLKVKTDIVKTGALTASLRNQFATLSNQKQMEEMEGNISGSFKNPVKVTAISFKGLNEQSDSIRYTCEYNVQNEVAELGDIKMVKIPFGDAVATVDNFSLSERKFPVEYWRYEDVDEYETVVEITAPAGTKFYEIPKDEKLSFVNGIYSLQYQLKGENKLVVTRKASIKKTTIPVEGYAAMKDFLNKIVKAEARYIAFKSK
ncbi:MAG: DUF3857 domain-containing protein [Agriterribacter sp.]